MHVWFKGTCSKHCINRINTDNLQGPRYFANYEQCSCTYLPFSIKDVLKSNFVSFFDAIPMALNDGVFVWFWLQWIKCSSSLKFLLAPYLSAPKHKHWKLKCFTLVCLFQEEDIGDLCSIGIFCVLTVYLTQKQLYWHHHETVVWKGLDGAWLFDFCMWVL